MPVLDTTLLVDIQRDPDRRRELVEGLEGLGEDLVVPAQVAIEFAAGEEDPAAAMRSIREHFTVAEVNDPLMLEAARLGREAHAAGRFPGWADVQIAATARFLGMALVTKNARHFEPLGVEVLSYDE